METTQKKILVTGALGKSGQNSPKLVEIHGKRKCNCIGNRKWREGNSSRLVRKNRCNQL